MASETRAYIEALLELAFLRGRWAIRRAKRDHHAAASSEGGAS